MPLTDVTIRSSIAGTLSKEVAGFDPVTQPVELNFTGSPPVATYSRVYLGTHTLAAAGSVTIDLRHFYSDGDGGYVSATGVLALMLRGTAASAGGQLRLEGGAADPLVWFWRGTSPYLLFDVGTSFELTVQAGAAAAVSGVARNVLLSNPGSAEITVSVVALVSGAAAADNDNPSLDFSDANNSFYLPMM